MISYHNGHCVVDVKEMIDLGVITRSNYNKLRHKFKVVREGYGQGISALVAWDSLHERFKDAIRRLHGGKDAYDIVNAKECALEKYIVFDQKVYGILEQYPINDQGKKLPTSRVREYYHSAMILDAIQRWLAYSDGMKHAKKAVKKTMNWDQIQEEVNALPNLKYNNTLTNMHPVSLKRVYLKYLREGCTSLIHRGFQNKNAAKVSGDETKEAVIIRLLADHRNFDNAQIARLFNEVAQIKQWKKITSAAVATYKNKYAFEITAGRDGEKQLRNNKLMQVKRTAPVKPMFFWTVDGWGAELLYQKVNEDDKKRTTTYHNRPTMVLVLDPCCKYPLGYAIGTHENPELIKEALRNAAQHSAELFGSMYRTHQFQSDNYGNGCMDAIYEVLGDKLTPARVGNAKSKIIEPWFNYFNKKYCQMMPNWSGVGITCNKKHQPNSEMLGKIKHSFPDFAGVVAQLTHFIEMERAEKREAYLKAWDQVDEADKLPLSTAKYLYHFGKKHNQLNMLTGSGLHVTINGIKQTYDSFEPQFRRHDSVRWQICYDPDDRSRVLAVNDDESIQFVLEEKYVQPMALKDRKEGDAQELSRINKYNEAEVASIVGVMTDVNDRVAELMEGNPELQAATLSKLLITDSRGQHKNQKSLAEKRAVLAKAETVPKPRLVIPMNTEPKNVRTMY